jgi:glutathione S-transferase
VAAALPCKLHRHRDHGHLRALEGRLECAEWLTGAEPSIADIAASAQLDEIVRTSTFAHELSVRSELLVNADHAAQG